MRRKEWWWRSLASVVSTLALLAVADARQARADAAQPAPPATETQSDVLGTPEPQEEKAVEAEESAVNKGRISLSIVNDFTTAYFFRGILQERNGFIWQPAVEVGINLWEGDEDSIFTSVDFGVGVWNSVQSEKTFATGGPTNLYETDIYPSLTVSFPNDLELSLVYQVYTSPNGAFDTIQNFDIGLAYDDTDLWGDSGFSVGPSLTVSFELEGTNFGDRRGSWLGLDAAPSIAVLTETDYPVTLAVPLALGLSISEYYAVDGEDDTFGFFSFGFSASVPLAFIPQDYGAWSVNAGINVLVLGDTLKDANLGDSPFPVGTGGIRMDY
jgi:hypothetical protein